MIRSFTLAAMVATMVLSGIVAAGPSLAQQKALDVGTFFGTFKGGGVADTPDSLYFGTTARDLDVTIGRSDDGFKVIWTSVIRGGGDPAKPNVRRKTSSRRFVPVRPGVYRGAPATDPLKGGELSWARISGNTLSVYLMLVRRDGKYEIQRYDRTLTGGGMKLVFTRVRDGEPVRRVTGRLVKERK